MGEQLVSMMKDEEKVVELPVIDDEGKKDGRQSPSGSRLNRKYVDGNIDLILSTRNRDPLKIPTPMNRTSLLSKLGTNTEKFIKSVIELPDIADTTKESRTSINQQYTNQFQISLENHISGTLRSSGRNSNSNSQFRITRQKPVRDTLKISHRLQPEPNHPQSMAMKKSRS